MNSMPKFVKNCPVCNKEFCYYISSSTLVEKKYCSKACRTKDARIVTHCPQCGKEFWFHKSWLRKYCSRSCSAKANIHRQLGVVELGEMKCEICGKVIQGPKWTGRKFCSRKCFAEHLHLNLMGKPRPEVRGQKPHLWTRVSKTCPVCGKEFLVKASHSSRRKYCSKKCQNRWYSESGIYSGENNFNWRGGYQPYYGPNWLRQRKKARQRDNYICQRCGNTESKLGVELDVHHIQPFRAYRAENYEKANLLSNLISLCHTCHLVVEHEDGRPGSL